MSRQRGYRLVLGSVPALFVFGGLTSVSPSAAADLAVPAVSAVTCTAPNIAVLVQFPNGGGDMTGCVSSASNPSGWTVLIDAGFTVQGTAQYPDTFVCRIDDVPVSQCTTTPQPKDSWSYWHADAGATGWTHSNLGAASAHPGAGSADAWTFGVGAPTLPPSQVVPATGAPAPPVMTSSAPTPVPRSKATTPPVTGTSTTPDDAVPSTEPAPGATSPSVDPAPTENSSMVAGSLKKADRHDSAVPTVVGGVLVALLAAAGGAATWRRRTRTNT